MDPLSLEQVAGCCGGVLLRGDPSRRIQGISTDSRGVRAGDLFAAIRGDRFDGHRFVSQAAQEGAVAALVEAGADVAVPDSFSLIQVSGTRVALGQLSAWWRSQVQAKCVAIAGSNGKTSTKDMLASVLSTAGRTVMSPASFNNDLGVPLTLLQLDRTTEFASLEVGTNHPGELRPLLEMIRPDHGILTSIGREHLEFFKDLDGVYREESVLADFIPSQGSLVVPNNLHRLDDLRSKVRGALVTVGWDGKSDWTGSALKLGWDGTSFEVSGPDPRYTGTYHLPLLGRHQAFNALLVIALAAQLGVSAEKIRSGLAQVRQPKMRLEPMNLGGVSILNDAYNANLDSMQAALSLVGELPTRGRRIAVLGDMGELGEASPESHAELGRLAAASALDLLVGVGPGMSRALEKVRSCSTLATAATGSLEEAAEILAVELRPGDLLLLKASRFMRLEGLVDLLSKSGFVAGQGVNL